MTEMSQSDLAQVEQAASERDALMEESVCLKEENATLYNQIASLQQAMISPESLMDNDAKVKYYTGLPSYKVLKAVFDFVYPCVKNNSRTVLPLFNQFLMALVRLRINMDIILSIFHTTLEYMLLMFLVHSKSG